MCKQGLHQTHVKLQVFYVIALMESLETMESHRNNIMCIVQESQMHYGELLTCIALAQQMPGSIIKINIHPSFCVLIFSPSTSGPPAHIIHPALPIVYPTLLKHRHRLVLNVNALDAHTYLKTLIKAFVIAVARVHFGNDPQLLRISGHQRSAHHKWARCQY